MRPRTPILLSLFLTFPLVAGTIDVTTTADSGPGSLRQAIETANSGACDKPCVIAFRIAGPVPETGYFTIHPQSLLPFVTAPDVTIDGSTQRDLTGDTNPFGPEIEIDGTDAGWGPGLKYVRTNLGVIRGLAINRFEGNGIVVDGSGGAHVFGNYVGIDPTGALARPNGANGILFIHADRAIIAGNTVGGNRGNGIFFHASNGTIDRNNIGFGRSTAFPIPNGAHGIDVNAPVAIRDNHIAYNALHGINAGPLARGPIERNRIDRNGLLSIEHQTDGPSAPPAITFARGTTRPNAPFPGKVIVRGSVHARPNTEVTVHIYAAPHRNEFGLAEATMLVGTAQLITDANGDATFGDDVIAPSALVAYGWVSATVTSGDGTSELAAPFPLASDAIEVTTTRDTGTGSLRSAIESVNARSCTHDEPCWIAFRVPDSELTGGVARFETASPLPVITNTRVFVDGPSQAWWTGDRTNGHEVEIRGAGLQFGTSTAPVADLFVRELTVRDVDGDGIRAFLANEDLARQFFLQVHSTSNANGIALSGAGRAHIIDGAFSGNRGDGIRLADGSYVVFAAHAESNGGRGIYGDAQSLVDIGAAVAAHNARAGIATASAAIRMSILARTFGNGGLGIDRNDDGVSPINETDDVTDAPHIDSAEYDATRHVTVVRGRTPTSIPPFLIDASPDRKTATLQFYSSTEPGEGEQPASTFTTPIRIEGTAFFAELSGDHRGRYITATRTIEFCSFEGGCTAVDTSEFSNGVLVE